MIASAGTSTPARCASSRLATAARTWSPTGCAPPASTLRTHRSDGSQFGFSALGGRFRGHIDGCLVASPAAITYPVLWENKCLGASSWKEVVKRGVVLARPVYAAQIALYQAYMELPNPALFTALNRDTWELHGELVPFDAALAQRMSDRAVEVVRASEAEELLPRAAAERTAVVCRGGRTAGDWHSPCPWQDRCWRVGP